MSVSASARSGPVLRSLPFAKAMADGLAKEDHGVSRRSVVGSVGGDGDVGVSLPVVGDAGGVGDVGVSNG